MEAHVSHKPTAQNTKQLSHLTAGVSRSHLCFLSLSFFLTKNNKGKQQPQEETTLSELGEDHKLAVRRKDRPPRHLAHVVSPFGAY